MGGGAQGTGRKIALEAKSTQEVALTCLSQDHESNFYAAKTNFKTKKKKDNANLPNIVFGCAVKTEGSTTNRVLSTINVTLSEVLMFRAPSFAFSYTNTISPAFLMQLPSELDWLLFLLLFPRLLPEPFGEVFWGRGLLGRDELWSFSRSAIKKPFNATVVLNMSVYYTILSNSMIMDYGHQTQWEEVVSVNPKSQHSLLVPQWTTSWDERWRPFSQSQ